jgi:two-component system LytT family response regulator
MQTLLGVLDPEAFVRIHRSIIVNVRHVKQIEPAAHGDYILTLDNSARIQSSRTYGDAIRKLVSNHP